MRNLSKNSLKRLLRPANGMMPGYAHFWTRYWFHNIGAARAYEQTNKRTNNLTGQGVKKYLTPTQRAEWVDYIQS